ncbi:GIY-YIG nuclease family protein [Psychroflexus sp. CAK1W]|nr:GIY-YIG nuclease family protein [Psychroflexus curvus]
MHWVYIIHSPSKDNYYIGEASDLKRRIEWHNNHQFKNDP